MSDFHTHRRKVENETIPPRVRHTNLRCCLAVFAPYGFRATYHHLGLSARIPKDPARDPASLGAAVKELSDARELWLAGVRDFAGRRRSAKAQGRRQVGQGELWREWQRGWGNIAYCPDPVFHPTDPLPVVIERILHAPEPPAGVTSCRVCGGREGTDGAPPLCVRCGVVLPEPGPALCQRFDQ
ncbi:hypothetical protein SRB5_36900 [Streptomyces sp. RB5]|uniref:Uncharacterized protein n=1 Tax=Streptomyces smaragdinus TaxID=2585196 RepID=A0A7K0CKM4_9ACTN|nr:hypothetical protein [Streptomyces smaragdinus]MQY13542.1 hypothetical protein [Streptomyces smaragdinus]